jgi:hypothetical protein
MPSDITSGILVPLVTMFGGGVVAGLVAHITTLSRTNREYRLKKLEELWMLNDKWCWLAHSRWQQLATLNKTSGPSSTIPLNFEDQSLQQNREAYQQILMISGIYFPDLKTPIERIAAHLRKECLTLVSNSDSTTTDFLLESLVTQSRDKLDELKGMITSEARSIDKSGFLPFPRL